MAFAEDRELIQAAADTALNQAQTYLDQLIDVVSRGLGTAPATVVGQSLSTGVPFSINAILPLSYSYPDLPSQPTDVTTDDIVPPDAPDVDGLADEFEGPDRVTELDRVEMPSEVPDAPDLPNEDNLAFSEIVPVEFADLDVVTLPEDSAINATDVYAFAEQEYTSTLLNPLKAKLLYDLTYGGYGIDTTDEVALFNRARDREVELAMTRIDDAGRSMASRGFPLPPGELSVYIDRAWQDMQNKVSGASRDITLERSKLFVENRQFTIREVKDLEQITMNYWNSVQERALNTAKATAEFAVAVYNAMLAKFKLRFEYATAQSAEQYQRIQAEAARARSELEFFRDKIAKYDVELRALVQPFQMKIEAYRAESAAYEANVRSKYDPARVKVDLYRARVDENRADAERRGLKFDTSLKKYDVVTRYGVSQEQLAVQNAQIKLNAAIASLQFNIEAAKFGATNYFAQLTALETSANTLSVQTEAVT